MSIETTSQSTSSMFFVIDTNMAMSNYDRLLCAYVTGQVCSSGVGSEYVSPSKVSGYDDWWKTNMGYFRGPAFDGSPYERNAIFENPDYVSYAPYGGKFSISRNLPAKELAEVKEKIIEDSLKEFTRTLNYFKELIAKKDFSKGWNDLDCQSSIIEYQSIIEKIKEGSWAPYEGPSMTSVAWVIHEMPPEHIIAEAKNRAYEFFNNILMIDAEVTGFRLVTETTVVSTTKQYTSI